MNIQKIFENNTEWVKSKLELDNNYFKELEQEQKDYVKKHFKHIINKNIKYEQSTERSTCRETFYLYTIDKRCC